jgi:hypothetical protein
MSEIWVDSDKARQVSRGEYTICSIINTDIDGDDDDDEVEVDDKV